MSPAAPDAGDLRDRVTPARRERRVESPGRGKISRKLIRGPRSLSPGSRASHDQRARQPGHDPQRLAGEAPPLAGRHAERRRPARRTAPGLRRAVRKAADQARPVPPARHPRADRPLHRAQPGRARRHGRGLRLPRRAAGSQGRGQGAAQRGPQRFALARALGPGAARRARELALQALHDYAGTVGSQRERLAVEAWLAAAPKP